MAQRCLQQRLAAIDCWRIHKTIKEKLNGLTEYLETILLLDFHLTKTQHLNKETVTCLKTMYDNLDK